MFSYLKGIITEISENTVTLEAAGVGYELGVSTQTASALRTGDETKLYTYLAVREDGVSLYGFAAKNEKNMFLRLTGVSGIGAKVAMAVLSGLSVSKLAEAVATGNLAALSSVKGIGKKTAERIILELKDKVAEEFGTGISGAGSTALLQSEAAAEAVLALVSLGYSKAEATAAVSKVANSEKLNAEQIILLALKS